jgi:hypothetical protein
VISKSTVRIRRMVIRAVHGLHDQPIAPRSQILYLHHQAARDFVDQFFRDINQIAYPNSRMADTSSPGWSPPLVKQNTYAWASPYINDNRFAIGLVKVDANEIRFEADTNEDGNVQSIVYGVNGSTLQRSQIDKASNEAHSWALAKAELQKHLSEVRMTPTKDGEDWHYVAEGNWDLLGTGPNAPVLGLAHSDGCGGSVSAPMSNMSGSVSVRQNACVVQNVMAGQFYKTIAQRELIY